MPTIPDETARGRPGLVPHPPNVPVMPRGINPDSAVDDLPHRSPPSTKGGSKQPPKAAELWTYTFDGKPGSELSVVETIAPIDLPVPVPLVVQFYQDTTRRAPTDLIPQPDQETTLAYHNFDDTQVIADPGDGMFRIVSTGVDSVAILIGTSSTPPEVVDGITHYGPVEDNPSLQTMARFKVRNSLSDSREYVYSVANVDTSNPQFVRINASFLSETIGTPLADGHLCYLLALTPVDPLELRPNSIARARLTYSAGKADEISFECDWAGALQLFANRLRLERVAMKADPEADYYEQAIKLAAVVKANAPRPAASPTLTELTEAISPAGTATFVAPPLARRVSLTALYGDEGAPGDAPLGQLFVAFVASTDRAIAYIDAMSARDALFGKGMPIPAGTRAVALSNLSADTSVRLGVVWHLGV